MMARSAQIIESDGQPLWLQTSGTLRAQLDIHDGDAVPPDGLGDTIIDRPGNGGGGAYAPYQLPYHSRRRGDRVLLYYVLFTWNPYQVVLLRHELSFRELAALG